jgi:hypothetical protein
MSIYLRYSSIPITLSRPFETASSRDENGDLKTINFLNQWGSFTTSFATSGFISLAATSGIVLNTPGYVDVSGIRASSVQAQNFYRMGPSGEIIDFYPGPSGGLAYKASNNTLGFLNEFVYSTGINKLISPTGNPGSPLFVHPSTTINEGDPPSREITTFSQMTFKPEIRIQDGDGPPTIIPGKVKISGANLITENIQIGFEGDNYKDTILVHQGLDQPAAWVKADYLKADGALWNRFPKRAVRLENDRIIFYREKQIWDLYNSTDDYVGFSAQQVVNEYGPGDTITIIEADSLNVFYIKPAVAALFQVNDPNPDPSASFDNYVENVSFSEVLASGADPTLLQGYAMAVCPTGNLPANKDEFVRAYAFSVTKGAYLTMQLEPDATANHTCGNTPSTHLTFKPSTLNTLSIRPDVHTSFNSLAENIDFVIYGKTKTPFDKYDPELFDLDENLLPTGLTAGFRLDANIPNAVLGTVASGVIYNQYLDREKTIPSGHIIDETPKVTINRNQAYSIANIYSGISTIDYYASLSVSGVTYTDQLLTQDIYLTPKPNADGTGKYIANALLTINSAGQIVSRVPTVNPTIPFAPSNLTILISGNNECSLRWDAPNDGGRTIVNYIIEFSVNDGNSWSTVTANKILRGDNTQTSCTITDLQTSITYLFRVKAQNSVGIGNASEPSSAFIANYDLSESVNNVNISRSFGDVLSIITLSWSEPDSIGSSNISGYIIEESDNNGLTWIYHNTLNSLLTSTSETIYGLNNNNNYLYRISAINNSGQGAYNYAYATGNIILPSTEEVEQQQEEDDVLTNWDFGVILFTGVCQS